MINLNSNKDYRISSVLEVAQKNLLSTDKTDTELQVDIDYKLDAMVLLSYVLSKPKSYLLTWPDAQITKGQYAMYQALIERRAKGEPIAYITGQKEFYSILLKVTPDTLIPRSETELLIDTVLEQFRHHNQHNIKILDLGTGTGAIAIALAKNRPNWYVKAVDKSQAALDVAIDNARTYNLNNVEFLQSDWFSNLVIDKSNITNHSDYFDCIVSNPPYISKSDPYLNTDIKYEPSTALISENNGLYDIGWIINNAATYLKPQGYLILEHGYEQQQDIVQIIKQNKNISDYKLLQDYAGLPRAILITY